MNNNPPSPSIHPAADSGNPRYLHGLYQQPSGRTGTEGETNGVLSGKFIVV